MAPPIEGASVYLLDPCDIKAKSDLTYLGKYTISSGTANGNYVLVGADGIQLKRHVTLQLMVIIFLRRCLFKSGLNMHSKWTQFLSVVAPLVLVNSWSIGRALISIMILGCPSPLSATTGSLRNSSIQVPYDLEEDRGQWPITCGFSCG